MLLVDSNVFIYARGRHQSSDPCRRVLSEAATHPEWVVPVLVLLEITHYYRDNGSYARAILRAFPSAGTLASDVGWAADNCRDHADFNDHVVLASAHRLGAAGVITLDGFFTRQSFFPDVRGMSPSSVV